MILILQKTFIPEIKQLEEKKNEAATCISIEMEYNLKKNLNSNEKLTKIERILIIF